MPERQAVKEEALDFNMLISNLVRKEVASQLENLKKYFEEVCIEAFNQITNTFKIEELKSKLLLLPSKMASIREKISEERSGLRAARQMLADAELNVKETEAAIMADIIAEVNPSTGKPKFSNDKARQAELMARKKTDPDYLAAVERLNDIKSRVEAFEDEIYSLDSQLKELETEFMGTSKVLEAVTAEMNIYAQMIGNNVKNLPSLVEISTEEADQNNQEKGAW